MLHAAVTIVALNYLPLARTVCRTFLEHHPGGRFFVLLVDRPGPDFDPSQEPFETVGIDDIALPFDGLFPYQYSILELSTAVKPFVMRYLLDAHGFPNLLYLDPDLYLMRPLYSVDEALRTHSIVLTPHMLAPPPDDGRTPSETDIMLSGVYNLGFLGVANDANTRALLAWWEERLATRCVVDLANALFVDQRWMDMAPSYFDKVCILKDRSLNVAYWNLHERQLTESGGDYFIDGRPLGFFHFSGFNPTRPERLSKHQTRHSPSDNPALSALSLEYASHLLDHGYLTLSDSPVPFTCLANGVTVGRLAQWVIRKAIDEAIPVPSPDADADGFCRFLMTPNYRFDPRGIAPLLVALERTRPDVKAAMAPAFESPVHADVVRSWLASSGAEEEGVERLFERYGELLDRPDVCQRAVDCWRGRADLQRAFPGAFSSLHDIEAYAGWIERHGTLESGFKSGEGATFLARRHGLVRPLMLFMQDPNLQREFKFPFLEKDRTRLTEWLYREAVPRGLLHHEDVAWFDGFATSGADLLAAIVLGHGAWLHANLVGGGTLFDTRQVSDMLSEYGEKPSLQFLHGLYLAPSGMAVLAQAEQYYHYNSNLVDQFRDAFTTGKGGEGLTDSLLSAMLNNNRTPDGSASFRHAPAATAAAGSTLKTLFSGMRSAVGSLSRGGKPEAARPPAPLELPAIQQLARTRLKEGFARIQAGRPGVNLAGYLLAPTGMGESVRSMWRTLVAGGIGAHAVPLFSSQYRLGDGPIEDELQRMFASHDPAFRTNLLVSNGDEYRHMRGRLPYAFFKGRRNIGYWVWETERLPASHADTEGLTEIWTPSEYSAAAIRAAVDVPVRVVPHVLDFDEIDRTEADRPRFGLPANSLVFGFFFDCKSVIERKNPQAVLAAFREAFGGNDRPDQPCTLLLKVNSPEASPKAFAKLRKAAEGLDVVWVTDELDRADTLALMKSVDVYVSLHRSEGFGLTLAEAMAMGKPVVASAYSGNVDFMNADNACLVTTPVVTTDVAHGPYEAGTRWGNPLVEEAARRLRDLCDPALRARLGGAASRDVRGQLHPETVGAHVARLLEQLENQRD